MVRRFFSILIPALLIGEQAEAQQVTRPGGWAPTGIYVGAKVGAFSTEDTAFQTRTATVVNSYEDPGYQGSVTLGWGARARSGWGYRVEFEGGYQESQVDSHTVPGIGHASGGDAYGKTQVLYGFANAYADMSLAPGFDLVAGGGIGAGRVSFSDFGIAGAPGRLDDSSMTFGYHLDAGFALDVTRATTLEATYRFTRFLDAEATATNGVSSEMDLDTHALIVGARIKL